VQALSQKEQLTSEANPTAFSKSSDANKHEFFDYPSN